MDISKTYQISSKLSIFTDFYKYKSFLVASFGKFKVIDFGKLIKKLSNKSKKKLWWQFAGVNAALNFAE